MSKHPVHDGKTRPHVLRPIVAVCVVAVVFLTQWFADPPFAVSILHVLAVLLVLRKSDQRLIWGIAGIASIATVCGAILQGLQRDAELIALTNAALVVLILGTTTLLGLQLRRVGEQLSRSDVRIQAIVNTAVESIITIDRRGIVQSFNRAAERMFGYEASDVVGKSVNMLMPSPHREQHDAYVQRYLNTGEARIIGIGREVNARRRDGTIFPIELAVSELDDYDIFTGIIRDVTDRKRAEARLRQAERLSAIGTLAAGLGHDMNNILLPLGSRLDVVEKQQLDTTTRNQVTEIRKLTQYLQELADGLHLLALDPEDVHASTASTQVSEWWDQVQTVLQRAVPKSTRFSVSIPANLPAIAVPSHRLTQAVLNLLVNAADAVEDNGIVRLWAEVDSMQEHLRIGVTDNGRGMSEDVKRRALEPFFTTKNRGLGTGLGLSLVHGMVQSAGGNITIDSELDQGTSIVLMLPIVKHDGDDVADDRANVKTRLARLCIENVRTRSLVRMVLENSGYTILPENDEDRTPDLLVTDVAYGDLQADQLDEMRELQIILLGSRSTDVLDPRLIAVENENDYEGLRAAIESTLAVARDR